MNFRYFLQRFTMLLVGRWMVWAVLGSMSLSARAAEGPDPLPALVQLLGRSEDPQLQLDILKGFSEALRGRRQVQMPAGWEQLEIQLAQNPNPEIRTLAQSLSLTFGSARARAALRQMLEDKGAEISGRRTALESLLTVRDPELAPVLQRLLSDPGLRGPALRGLAAYDHSQTPAVVLAVYPTLSPSEKRDALSTLSARVAFAKPLLKAVEERSVPARDLTAEVVRQLRTLKDADLDRTLERVWGVARESGADKQQEIAKYRAIYRAGGSQPGDAIRGRVVFARTCQQCHVLFDAGGKVGPDLTGSNRSDLEYTLQNIVDPNAVIPNEYRSSALETRDDRLITGIVKQQDNTSVTVVTANEVLVVPRGEVRSLQHSDISMMPEGLLANLADQEVRDLIYYLGRPAQVPLLAAPETVPLFFNGKDLANWQGNTELWTVEEGQIVGRSLTGLKRNEFLKSQIVFGDFRLICQVKLSPNTENSGIQFRSEALPNGDVKGYQADIGAGWWGKLYEEHGREILWNQSVEDHVKAGDWNTYEIVAVGRRILTAINGKPSVQLDDSAGSAQGIIALQLHSGGPLEVRFKDFQIELNPKPELKTGQVAPH